MSELPHGWLKRFRQDGDVEALGDAVESLRKASLGGDADLLAELALALHLRGQRRDDPAEREQAARVRLDLLARDDLAAETRARVLVSHANALLDRHEQTAGSADAVNSAEAAAREAVGLSDVSGRQRAAAHNVLATCLTARFVLTGRREHLDDAVAEQHEACRAIPEGLPEKGAMLANLCQRLLYLYDVEPSDDVSQAAVTAADEALAYGLGPAWRSAALDNLGLALRDRYERLGDPADLRRALAAQTEAVELSPPNSASRARCLNNLANATWTNYLATGRLADLDAATAQYRRAADAAVNTHTRAACHLGLGTALWSRWSRRSEPQDLAEAETVLREAVSAFPVDGPDSAHARLDLASVLFARWRADRDEELLDEAVTTWEAVLAHPATNPGVHDSASGNLGAALLERHAVRGEAGDLDAAIDLLAGHARSPDARVPLRPSTWYTLAGALLLRSQATRSADDAAGAAEAYRQACTEGLAANPAVALQSGQDWGRWAARDHDWTTAAGAYDIAWDAALRLYRGQDADQDVELWLGQAVTLAPRRAVAHARLGSLVAAATALEQGRAYLFSQALTAPAARPSAQAEERTPPDPGGATGTLLYVVPGRDGGLALAVTGSRTELHELPGLTEEAVEALAGEFVRAGEAARKDPPRWHRTIARTCASLWDILGGDLGRVLSNQPRAHVVPTGLLALLPVQAATGPDGTSLLDTVALAYAPNARMVQGIPPAPWADAPAFVVSDPGRTDLSPLPFAGVEERAVRRNTSAAPAEPDRSAPGAVLEALGRHRLVHLSCHAVAYADRPWESRLFLAGGDLTVEALRRTDLHGLDLVFLSACETAKVGRDIPDETVGFPAAFLRAGAKGVVATLWPVPQAATALLVDFFYDMLPDAHDPAVALSAAQRAVRDAPADEVERRLALAAGDFPATRPFRHPYFWAGFTYSGV